MTAPAICAEIVRSALNYSPAHFRAQTYEILCALCHFDAAVSGVGMFGVEARSAYDCTQLHNLPTDIFVEYARVADNDGVHIEVARRAHLNISHFTVRDHTHEHRFEDFLAYTDRHGLRHLLYALSPQRPKGSRNYIALWRGSREQCYESAEVVRVQDALLCAVEASIINHALAIKSAVTTRFSGALHAIADANGIIQSCDPGLCDLLSRQWPSWPKPQLPPQLLSGLGTVSKAYVFGRHVFISISRLPHTFLVIARPEPMLSVLSDRELDVIQLMARGYSIKRTANILAIADKTVQHYLTRIYAALNVRDGKKAALTGILLDRMG